MRESAELAKRLIEESCAKQNIQPGQLTLHADRGTSMSSKPVAFLLADLGRHQDAQPPARLRRQSVFGKPVPHHEISAGVPGSLRLHSGQPGFFAGIFPLVQRGTPPLRAGLAHAGHGPLQPNRAHPRTAPNRSRCRLSRPSRTLRPPGPQTTQRFQPRSGSTNRSTQMKILTKFHDHWSQTR